LNHDERRYFYSEDIENLKQDLEDLGKLRVINYPIAAELRGIQSQNS